MKKIYTIMVLLGLLLTANLNKLNGQTIFSEDFTTATWPGWTLVNNDGLTPAAAVNYVTNAWVLREDFITGPVTDTMAVSTSWYTPAGTADDWMISPAITLQPNLVLTWLAMAPDPAYPDGYEVRISTTTPTMAGCLANPPLFSIAAEADTWTEQTVDLNAAGYTTGTCYIAWRNNSNDDFLLFIDSIRVAVPPGVDLTPTALNQSEYTQLPLSESMSLTLGGTITNNGTSTANNSTLTVNVYDEGNVVYTQTSTPTNIPGSGSSVEALGTYAPVDTGLHRIQYIVSTSDTDSDPLNDTVWVMPVWVTQNTIARDDSTVAGTLGIGAGNGGYLGTEFNVPAASNLESVTFLLDPNATGGLVGDYAKAHIWDINAGEPNTIIGETDSVMITTPGPHWITLNVLGGPLAVPADFVVTVEERDSTQQLAYSNNVFTATKGWVDWPTNPFAPWANNEQFGFNVSYVLWANFQAPPPPTASLTTGSTTICVGDSVTYTNTSTNATSFNWDFPGGSPPSGSTSPINVTYNTMGSYTTTLVASSPFGVDSTTVVITVNDNPTPTSSNGGPYCEGDMIQLNSGGGSTYSWVGPASFSSSAQNPTIASSTTANAGTYTVTVTNAAGCSATATTAVTVNATPTATASNTGPYCLTETIQLNSSGGSTYSWVGPNSFSSSSQNPSITNATAAEAGVYTVTVTSASGCTATAVTTVTVGGGTATASNTGPYCEGATVSLSTIGGASGYAWVGPASFSSSLQNPTIASSTTANAGTYSVTVTYPGGCTATATTDVIVNANPTNPVITAGGPTTFCADDSVTLTSSYGTGNMWSTSDTTSSITVNTTANYVVTYTDGNGCSSSDSVSVTVNALPTLTVPNFGTTCVNYGPITLTGETPTGGTYSGAGVTGNSFDPSTAGVGNHPITYTYTDGNGCTNSQVTNIDVLACLDIQDQVESGGYIGVYPNPAQGQFELTVLLPEVDNISIKIQNSLGQVVKVLNIEHSSSYKQYIDISTWRPGVYYVEVETSDFKRSTKLIKQ